VVVRIAIAVLLASLAAGAGRTGSAATAASCVLTPVSAKPPNAWMGTLSNHWLRSGTLWMGYTRADHAFVARPNGQKIPWYRAAGSPWGRLRVTGSRIDALAAPLRFSTPATYPFRLGFQSSSMTFSSEGCWRIVARVGLAKRFVFVVRVEPDDGRL
jgi:hypothetical protein